MVKQINYCTDTFGHPALNSMVAGSNTPKFEETKPHPHFARSGPYT